jgi:DNA repair exonuclease SbcCD ATPase subunit
MDLPDTQKSAEIRFEIGLKKLAQAWKLKEKELESYKSLKLNTLVKEHSHLKQLHSDLKKKIITLEEKKSEIQERIKEVYLENIKLESFKNKVLDSLKEEDYATKSYKPELKSIEEEGRQFFLQAKSRLSYENFTAFSAYVKQLNEDKITKDQVVYEIKDLFDIENNDLYEAFVSLLNRY